MIRTFILAVAVLAAATVTVPLAAQEPVPPRFFIEKIEVRDAKRVSTDVVIAESRLREGQEYTEADLRDASSRLGRLPFLLSAEFALEKGSERGRYVLVVTVNETKPFFYALDLRPILKSDDNISPDYSDRIGVADNAGTLGMRWFLGRRGALHVALVTTDYGHDFARDYAAIALGYTQYDLFGTRAFATLNLKRVLTEGSGAVSPQLVVGIPVTANQTVTVDLDETRFGDETRENFGRTLDTQRGQRIIGATWSYNTTDRPVVPTRGTLLSVHPRIGWTDFGTTSTIVILDPNSTTPTYYIDTATYHSEAREITVNAAHYWPLSERSSVSAGFEAGITDYDIDTNLLISTVDHETRAIVTGGYSYSLWDAARSKNGDSRLELNARIGNRSIDYSDFYRADSRQVSASWVRRSSWGVLRLGAGYAW
jgi:outer membrane protein assembly factor BamA